MSDHLPSPQVAIVIATFDPDIDFFRQQFISICDQTYKNFICIISDDSPSAEKSNQIRELTSKDPRFEYHRNLGKLGVWHNFEAGFYSLLENKPVTENLKYVLPCDQDDIWDREKVETLVNYLNSSSSCSLIHNDLRLIDSLSQPLGQSCWVTEKRHTKSHSVLDLILKNSVTGCAAAFRIEVLKIALPFPTQAHPPAYYHDLWIALCATQVGKIIAHPKVLQSYRQHSHNLIGAILPQSTHSNKPHTVGSKPNEPSRKQVFIQEWQLRNRIETDLLVQLISHGKKTFSRHFGSRRIDTLRLIPTLLRYQAKASPYFQILLRIFMGKILSDLSSIRRFYNSLSWITKKSWTFIQVKSKKARYKLQILPPRYTTSDYTDRKSLIPLALALCDRQQRRFNLLVPTLQPEHIFGGIATALSLAGELLLQGHEVCLISTDSNLNSDQERQFWEFAERFFPNFKDFKERLTVADARDRQKQMPIIGKNDLFIATAWWTAIQAQTVIQNLKLNEMRFIYLIQDFEPHFYPWSQDFALALHSYSLNYVPIFNAPSLAEYFKSNGHTQIQNLEEYTLAPQIDLGKFFPPSLAKMKNRNKLRVFAYGRPKVDRNLFDTIVCGLDEWIRRSDLKPEQVQIFSAGETHPTIFLHNDVPFQSLGKLPLALYPHVLRTFDIGISLMLSPHPSYPPLEMAASGMLVVNNIYECKDLSKISANFINCQPIPGSVAQALTQAQKQILEHEKRIEKSRFIFPNCRSLPQVAQKIAREFEI